MPSDPRTRAIAALRFRALGDETRLLLLELLSPGEQCVADLMDRTGLGQSLVSHHLRTLRTAGLVHARRDGRWIYYSLVEPALAATRAFVFEIERVPETGII
jgi:ArsR family transcriptional regulator, arsenate/arsenite/antimonite-responsive transcriptional repressor